MAQEPKRPATGDAHAQSQCKRRRGPGSDGVPDEPESARCEMKNNSAPRRHGVTEKRKRRMALMPIPTVTLVSFLFLFSGCNHTPTGEVLTPKTTGTALVESSGGKQVADVGNNLPQPVVVQVNGADGNAVTGALISFHGDGLTFTPDQALSDSGGQVSVVVQVGTEPRNYTLIAETLKPDHSKATLELRETAL